MRPSRFAIVLLIMVLVACGSSSTIQPVSRSRSAFEGAVYEGERKVVSDDTSGTEQYRVFEKGGTGFVPLSSVRSAAEERATQFCERQGKALNVLTEHTSKPPHILGNFPRVELTFVCVPKANLATESFQDEKFIKLTNLKKLLDSGVITQEEFEKEKAKILRDQ